MLSKNVFQKISIFFVSSVISFFICERVLLRNYYPQNHLKGWFSSSEDGNFVLGCDVLDPYMIFRHVSSGPQVEYCKFDNDGFRDLQIPTNPVGEKIIFMGDSSTFGHGVNNDESYPSQVQKMFNDINVPVEVTNAGISGTGTDQQIIYFEKYVLPKKKPDVVVWNLNENDLWQLGDNNMFCLFSVDRDDQLVTYPAWLNTLYIKGKIYFDAPQFLKKSKIFSFLIDHIPDRWTFGCSKSKNMPFEYHTNKLRKLIEKMSYLSTSNHFKLIFVLIEEQRYFIANENGQVDEDYQSIINSYKQAIRNVNFEPIDMYESVKLLASADGISSPSSSFYLGDDGGFEMGIRHMNKLGNTYFARVVFDYLHKLIN